MYPDDTRSRTQATLATVRGLLATVGLSVLLATAAPATPIRVSLIVDDSASVETAATVTASPVASDSEQELPEPVVFEATAPGEATLDLSPGLTWQLEVEAAGLWARPELIVGGSDLRELSVRMIPTATLIARVETAAGSEQPGELGVRFRSPGETSSAPVAESEKARCPIVESRWRCDVPSGTFDLRLRAPGFVSHYLWERELPPAVTVDLGRVELVPGSSVSGWLVTEDDSPIRQGTKVAAIPQATRPGAPQAEARHRSLANRAAVTDRGFFHLQGLLPGAYVLDAEQEGYVPLRSRTVVVIEGLPSELIEPLVLTRPADLRVTVDPPVDRLGEPWGLTLGQQQSGARTGRSEPDGSWTTKALRPGTYTLMVASSQGSRLAVEEVEVEGPATEHWVALDFVEVEGALTLGGEPLAAELAFGRADGPVSIRLQADEEGRFSGSLPRSGNWDVDVRSKSAGISRRLRAIEVEPAAGSDYAWVEIDLPATRIEGEVVDAQGHGVARATVLAVPVPTEVGDPAERPSHVRSEDDGSFVLSGFEPALYRLQAIRIMREGRQLSEPVEVTLDQDDPPRRVRLVLDSQPFRGRVLSGSGGVAGVTVTARALGVTPGISIPAARTGPDGRFELSLPAGAGEAELTVLAPGFLFYRRLVAIPDGQELPITLQQQGGGTLVIRPNDAIVLAGGQGLPWIVREDGTDLDLGTLSRWSMLNRAPPAGAVLEAPKMPSGTYRVCWPLSRERRAEGDKPHCDQGYLPAYGRLEFTQESSEDPGPSQTLIGS